MSIELEWVARRLRTDIIRLRIATGLLICTGLVMLFVISHPMPGLLVMLCALFALAAASSRATRLRRLERRIKDLS
ncbi:hypothetical protein HPO96_22605 [Kribbella sandramycini]|uniref:Putative membrane protein YccC n=1 Tax=Kribbella sandramycini TaxID=60450 RepID=A0A7Y4L2D4_9ACTN|nr:hypothetical protein [Kribbella sandramycini]MBB6566295.1 putative membrane protein YccC [Kribbella sandramycini]NOL43042.1 hypothetical protein [Kribbella sandramycini]